MRNLRNLFCRKYREWSEPGPRLGHRNSRQFFIPRILVLQLTWTFFLISVTLKMSIKMSIKLQLLALSRIESEFRKTIVNVNCLQSPGLGCHSAPPCEWAAPDRPRVLCVNNIFTRVSALATKWPLLSPLSRTPGSRVKADNYHISNVPKQNIICSSFPYFLNETESQSLASLVRSSQQQSLKILRC